MSERLKLRNRSVLEEGEDGDDPAMDGRCGDAELEDRVHMLLDRRVGQEQSLLDARVGLALRHLSQNIELTRGQRAERARRACLLPRDEGVEFRR
jgi:hypothetical protein